MHSPSPLRFLILFQTYPKKPRPLLRPVIGRKLQPAAAIVPRCGITVRSPDSGLRSVTTAVRMWAVQSTNRIRFVPS